MDALGDPPWWVVVVFLIGVVLTNVGMIGWRRGRIGDWYEAGMFAVFVPMAVSTIAGWTVLFAIAAVGFVVLGSCGVYLWIRSAASGGGRRH